MSGEAPQYKEPDPGKTSPVDIPGQVRGGREEFEVVGAEKMRVPSGERFYPTDPFFHAPDTEEQRWYNYASSMRRALDDFEEKEERGKMAGEMPTWLKVARYPAEVGLGFGAGILAAGEGLLDLAKGLPEGGEQPTNWRDWILSGGGQVPAGGVYGAMMEREANWGTELAYGTGHLASFIYGPGGFITNTVSGGVRNTLAVAPLIGKYLSGSDKVRKAVDGVTDPEALRGMAWLGGLGLRGIGRSVEQGLGFGAAMAATIPGDLEDRGHEFYVNAALGPAYAGVMKLGSMVQGGLKGMERSAFDRLFNRMMQDPANRAALNNGFNVAWKPTMLEKAMTQAPNRAAGLVEGTGFGLIGLLGHGPADLELRRDLMYELSQENYSAVWDMLGQVGSTALSMALLKGRSMRQDVEYNRIDPAKLELIPDIAGVLRGPVAQKPMAEERGLPGPAPAQEGEPIPGRGPGQAQLQAPPEPFVQPAETSLERMVAQGWKSRPVNGRQEFRLPAVRGKFFLGEHEGEPTLMIDHDLVGDIGAERGMSGSGKPVLFSGAEEVGKALDMVANWSLTGMPMARRRLTDDLFPQIGTGEIRYFRSGDTGYRYKLVGDGKLRRQEEGKPGAEWLDVPMDRESTAQAQASIQTRPGDPAMTAVLGEYAQMARQDPHSLSPARIRALNEVARYLQGADVEVDSVAKEATALVNMPEFTEFNGADSRMAMDRFMDVAGGVYSADKALEFLSKDIEARYGQQRQEQSERGPEAREDQPEAGPQAGADRPGREAGPGERPAGDEAEPARGDEAPQQGITPKQRTELLLETRKRFATGPSPATGKPYTLAELRKLAEKRGVIGRTKMNKKALVDALTESFVPEATRVDVPVEKPLDLGVMPGMPGRAVQRMTDADLKAETARLKEEADDPAKMEDAEMSLRDIEAEVRYRSEGPLKELSDVELVRKMNETPKGSAKMAELLAERQRRMETGDWFPGQGGYGYVPNMEGIRAARDAVRDGLEWAKQRLTEVGARHFRIVEDVLKYVGETGRALAGDWRVIEPLVGENSAKGLIVARTAYRAVPQEKHESVARVIDNRHLEAQERIERHGQKRKDGTAREKERAEAYFESARHERDKDIIEDAKDPAIMEAARRIRDALDLPRGVMEAAGHHMKLGDEWVRVNVDKARAVWPRRLNKHGIDTLLGSGAKSTRKVREIAEAMVERGDAKTVDDALARLYLFRKNPTRAEFGYFDKVRSELSEEFIDYSPEVLEQHLKQSWLIAEATRKWGGTPSEGIHEHMPGLRRRLQDMEESTEDPAMVNWVKEYHDQVFGLAKASPWAEGAIWGTINKLQTHTKLGFSPLGALKNMTQWYTTGALFVGPEAWLRSTWELPPFYGELMMMAESWSHAPAWMKRQGAKYRQRWEDVEALGGIQARTTITEMERTQGKLGRASMRMFERVERGNQGRMSLGVKYQLERDINRLMQKSHEAKNRLSDMQEAFSEVFGPRDLSGVMRGFVTGGTGNRATLRRMSQFSTRSPKELANKMFRGEGLTKDEIKAVIYHTSRRSQYFLSPMNNMKMWNQSPAFRALMKFKNFQMRQFENVVKVTLGEAAHGNVGPLLKLAAVSIFLNELMLLPTDLLFGRERSLSAKVGGGQDIEMGDLALRILGGMAYGAGVQIVDATFGVSDAILPVWWSSVENVYDMGEDVLLSKDASDVIDAGWEAFKDEVVVAKQASELVERVVFDDDELPMLHYQVWRQRGYEWHDRKEREEKGLALDLYQGVGRGDVPDFEKGIHSMSYKHTAEAVLFNDMDLAVDTIRDVFDAEQQGAKTKRKWVTEIRSQISQFRRQRTTTGPFGKVPQKEKAEFLSQWATDKEKDVLGRLLEVEDEQRAEALRAYKGDSEAFTGLQFEQRYRDRYSRALNAAISREAAENAAAMGLTPEQLYVMLTKRGGPK